MQKVERNIAFHTAMSTAFPQPAPGTAPSPGPMKVEPERLRSVLGITNVMGHDSPSQSVRRVENVSPNQIALDNFAFSPTPRTVSAGVEVTWINRDDVPHIIVDTKGTFSSRVLDTNQQYSHRFATAGTYNYFCSIHPKMTGTVVVT